MAIEKRVITSMPEFLLTLEAGFAVKDSLTIGDVLDATEMLDDLSTSEEELSWVTKWVERGDYYVEIEE